MTKTYYLFFYLLLAAILFWGCSLLGKDPEPSKILIVGIDGAEWSILDPLIQEKKTPAMAELIEKGVRSRLKTLEPALSPAIWTTIATGKYPGKHKIFGFIGIPGETMKTLPTTQMRETKALWNIVSDAEKSVGMINWWVTWPSEAVNGFMVSDRVTYSRMEASIGEEVFSKYDTYPQDLLYEIKGLIQKPNEISNAEVKRFMDLDDAQIEKYIRGSSYKMGKFLPEFKFAYMSDKSTARIGEHLFQNKRQDVFGIYFAGVDVVSHLFWHFMEPEKFQRYNIPQDHIARFGKVIENTYIYTDELLGRLLKIAGDEYTVFVLSDHGFGPTGQLPWSGGHGKITTGAPIAPDGILIMSGGNIKKGVTLEGAHVADILPTILALLGLPVARDRTRQGADRSD